MAKEPGTGGYDYSFLGEPDDDLVCSICLLVQREPVLTSCCGNHFCQSCIGGVRSQGMPCPLCNAQKFSIMIDKYFVRKVKELKVHCPQDGCDWEGTLGSLERHLDLDSGGCEFLLIACPNACGKKVPTSTLNEHDSVCPRRKHVCKFCGYKGVYEEMSSKHWTVCDNYPLPCPNSCGELEIKRKDLATHQIQECPLQVIECEFSYAGCGVKVPRKEMDSHQQQNVHCHLSLVSRQCVELMKQVPLDFQHKMHQELAHRDAELNQVKYKLKGQEQEVVQLKKRVREVEEELDELKGDCFPLKYTVFVAPIEFIMTDFRKHKRETRQWLSPPFYSHLGGYCLCLSVDAQGSEDGLGSHTSLYVNIMKGEFDSYLQWPFRGNIKVVLCNQRSKKHSVEESIMFGYDAPREVAGRVELGEVAQSGLGIPKFIEHTQLVYNPNKNTEYLKNNCLRFRIESVTVSA